MSEVKVNKISPRTNCGTVTLGDSGDSFVIPAGATITNNGTQTGFGRTGTVNWNTTAITADPNPAVSGTGYFVDTTSGAITITLPTSPSAGDIVAFKDYALTFDTNNLIIDPGSNKIEGDTTDMTVETEGRSLTLVYTDSTQGWKVVNDGNSTAGSQALYVTATGGTVTCCGNYKIHTFTGPGTFTVTCAGNAAGSNSVDYLVVAGGGGSGSRWHGGGGGAGGYRESSGAASGCYTRSPLGACVSALPVTATAYPITVGGGGPGGPFPGNNPGTNGSNSVFSTITSAGGGTGGGYANNGGNGGSGGGGGASTSPSTNGGGAGNTPPVSPPQGTNGGNGAAPTPNGAGGGGAGATDAGTPTPGNTVSGPGGDGATSSINGTPTARAGGGAGGRGDNGTPGTGGTGGGGNSGTAGTTNTGGGGGAPTTPCSSGTSGGSGIVIIRYKYQ